MPPAAARRAPVRNRVRKSPAVVDFRDRLEEYSAVESDYAGASCTNPTAHIVYPRGFCGQFQYLALVDRAGGRTVFGTRSCATWARTWAAIRAQGLQEDGLDHPHARTESAAREPAQGKPD